MKLSHLSENKELKRICVIFVVICVIMFLSGFFSAAHSQIMDDYCQIPPSLSGMVAQPNVLLDIDVSGSMCWSAYNTANDGQLWCDISSGCISSHIGDEEGYFTPTAVYSYNLTEEYWQESAGAFTACPFRKNDISTSNQYQGSCLNFLYMSRFDLVRWAITGGTPASCSGGSSGGMMSGGGRMSGGWGGGGGACGGASGGGGMGGMGMGMRTDNDTFDPDYCDPELWDQIGNSTKVGTVCNNTIGGCILVTSDGEMVKVPWSRVYDALAFKFSALPLRPRLGALFFSGSSSTRMRCGGSSGTMKEEVYIGDYIYSDSTGTLYPVSTAFPYMNLITNINSAAPEGNTPTGPAMNDSFNYFKQDAPAAGGLDPQTNNTDKWRNPMYVCDEDPTDDAGGPSSNCVLMPCAKNYVLLLSDGEWNSGIDPVKPSHAMHGTFTNTAPGVNVDTRVKSVHSIGLFIDSIGGTNAMKHVAMYGAFDKTYDSYINYSSPTPIWPDNMTGYPFPDSMTALTTLIPSPDWDSNGDSIPDTFHNANNAIELKDAIEKAVLETIETLASGTTVSVLASGEGSGSLFLHAGFHPKNNFGSKEISWVGTLQNLWFYLDPRLANTTIREDTNGDKDLTLELDRIINFRFDAIQEKTVADLYDSDGAGNIGLLQNTVEVEDINYLWEAGSALHSRLSSDTRTIYTTADGSTGILFDTGQASTLQSLLQASDATEAGNIISYIRGDSDINTSLYRDRTVTYKGTSDAIWKLGDIIHSTPKIVSWIRLNRYDSSYKDLTYSSFLSSNAYRDRGRVINGTAYGSGMVFAGANDGMLHAFRLGALEIVKDNTTTKAALTGANQGREEWAFIPKNALPYLKYLMDKSYCHLYYVDATPYIFDASICAKGSCTGNYWEQNKDVNSWRTILIGGMRLGGGCRDTVSTYGVQTPLSGEGYSSYFALDITDPTSPSLLWEFSDPTLGFSTTGPSIIRINSRDFTVSPSTPDKTKNGRWFVVFGSGPTGPIDGGQFKGYSDQNLKLFILDLKTGTPWTIDTGIANAFGGSLNNASVDYDLDYQDDVLYLGYTKAEDTPIIPITNWTQGGVIRLITKEDLDGPILNSTALDPSNWEWSNVIKDTGPITSAVAHLAHYKSHIPMPDTGWLFFGTGRYFFEGDDSLTQRMLFGIKDLCLDRILGRPVPYTAGSVCTDTAAYTLSFSCADPYVDTTACGDINNATVTVQQSSVDKGWYINLEGPDNTQINSLGDSYITPTAERVITDPVATPAGAVFFTTFAPSTGLCAYGGNSFLWAVTYDTGGAAAENLFGKALIQTSTGSIEQADLRTDFDTKKAESGTGSLESEGRRTGQTPGVPPSGQGLSLIVPPMAINKITHIQKK